MPQHEMKKKTLRIVHYISIYKVAHRWLSKSFLLLPGLRGNSKGSSLPPEEFQLSMCLNLIFKKVGIKTCNFDRKSLN